MDIRSGSHFRMSGPSDMRCMRAGDRRRFEFEFAGFVIASPLSTRMRSLNAAAAPGRRQFIATAHAAGVHLSMMMPFGTVRMKDV